jgi:hypothetical protein
MGPGTTEGGKKPTIAERSLYNVALIGAVHKKRSIGEETPLLVPNP